MALFSEEKNITCIVIKKKPITELYSTSTCYQYQEMLSSDILIILLGNLQNVSPEFHVWMELRHFTKNNFDLLMFQIFTSLGSTLAHSLPGCHAFTGCDFTASFLNKGKQKPFEIRGKCSLATSFWATWTKRRYKR